MMDVAFAPRLDSKWRTRVENCTPAKEDNNQAS